MIARHDEYSELLGAFALDAVEPEEAAAVDVHLRTCAVCAAEVAEHREVAALLANGGTTVPDGMWDRLALELSPAPPAMRMTLTAEAPERAGAVVDLRDARRRSVPARVMVAVLGVAACMLAFVGALAVNQNQRIDHLENALIAAKPTAPATGAVDVRLTGGGDLTAQAVVDRTGVGRLYAGDLPKLPDGDVYQLWGKVDGTLLSLGAFGSSTDVMTFQMDPGRLNGVQAFAVTQERSPGVVTSTHDAVVAGTV